jgi:adenosylcobinamide kinase/adenosylcobinamide-phosphate guanylyltransferase
MSLTLILGGARSGKSSHAQSLAEATGKPVTFLATAQALDQEMAARIHKHQAERPAGWQTLEIPSDIASHGEQIRSDIVVLDCVTLLVSNLLMQFVREDRVDEEPFLQAVQTEIEGLMEIIREQERDWFIISNVVGLGLVPPYKMGRVYRDALGSANQRLAREADRVLFLVAGIPMVVK